MIRLWDSIFLKCPKYSGIGIGEKILVHFIRKQQKETCLLSTLHVKCKTNMQKIRKVFFNFFVF